MGEGQPKSAPQLWAITVLLVLILAAIVYLILWLGGVLPDPSSLLSRHDRPSAVANKPSDPLTVRQLVENADPDPNKSVRIKGKIVDGSVDYDAKVSRLRFDLNEGPGSQVVHVVSPELMPDNFKAGNECIVEGTFDRATSSLFATKVITRW